MVVVSVVCTSGQSTPYPCGGNGQCSADGTCACAVGYYGTSCRFECPGGAENPCNGNGNCTVRGECVCLDGFWGLSCLGICPGGQALPCFRHGECNNLGQCTCYQNTTGYFAGTSCDQCRIGYAGASCNEYCSPTTASSIDRECICLPGFAGSNCTVQCPQDILTGEICSGRGTCPDGNRGNATCACEANYFGPICGTVCTAEACASSGMLNAQCNSVTGSCECLNNGFSHFTGAQCDTCVDGFWGTFCHIACNCNNHGSCQQFTGDCLCYQDSSRGYWAGTQCSHCSEGFISATCRQRSIQIASKSPVTTPLPIKVPTDPSW